MFKNLSLFWKIPLAYFVLTVASSVIPTPFAISVITDTIRDSAYRQLEAHRDQKIEALQTKVELVSNRMIQLSNDYSMSTALQSLSSGLTVVAQEDPWAIEFLRSELQANRIPDARQSGFNLTSYLYQYDRWASWGKAQADFVELDDLYILNLKGDVVFTAGDHGELGLNVTEGDLAATSLGRVALEAIEIARNGELARVVFADFEPYALRGNASLSFFAAPVFDQYGDPVGVFVGALPLAFFDLLKGDLGFTFDTHVSLFDKNKETVASFVHRVDGADLASDHLDSQEIISRISTMGQSGVETVELSSGERAMVGYRTFDLLGGTYGIAIEADEDQVLALLGVLYRILGLAGILAFLTTGAGAILVARSISRPSARMSLSLQEVIRNRDMSARLDVESEDEIGRSSRAMNEILELVDGTIGEFHERSVMLGGEAARLEQASHTLAANAESQSTAIEELSTTIEQTSHQVRSNALASKAANDVAQNTTATVSRGREKLDQMVEAIKEINTSSSEIANIIKVIDEIAFQTNLLALNAAVEAARAGQHGRGFAVVAAEVRNLAGRSAKAARETSDLIDKSARRVDLGVALTQEASKSFDQINDDFVRIAELVENISVASEEQARGVELVNDAINDLSKIARSTSIEADGIAETAEQLTSASRYLKEQVGKYRSSAIKTERSENTVAETVSKPALRSAPLKQTSFEPASVANDASPIVKPRAVSSNSSSIDEDERGYGTF
ncbi:methyl-accepting chemotaxis protein (plasmid) [Marivivens sp. LCG002]|uniref:methyl-accepting chemotaxis protein n=1 Tax=Marivivens sp. LCG002 TaxID=3051171 RepID=UPI0025575F21|nr:methyl-accepting chemotaxis protein [Marivivens sp. LCG002]WIV52380.1 methyl-accepting chemotaxis protein [Marivivens sp. LCG002]